MSTLKLIIKEIAHRKVNALLWLLAVTWRLVVHWFSTRPFQ